MSEPTYNENDTPLDKLRYRKYQKEQGNDCVEKTEPTIVDIILGLKWYCVPSSFPDIYAEQDRVCKKLSPIIYPELLFLDEGSSVGPHDTEEECNGNCEQRWFCSEDTGECELQNRINEDGSLKPVGYSTEEECNANCPTPTESPSGD